MCVCAGGFIFKVGAASRRPPPFRFLRFLFFVRFDFARRRRRRRLLLDFLLLLLLFFFVLLLLRFFNFCRRTDTNPNRTATLGSAFPNGLICLKTKELRSETAPHLQPSPTANRKPTEKNPKKKDAERPDEAAPVAGNSVKQQKKLGKKKLGNRPVANRSRNENEKLLTPMTSRRHAAGHTNSRRFLLPSFTFFSVTEF